MKKQLILSLVILVTIFISGCQFNIFSEFDKIEIPSRSDLLGKASSDPVGFLDDVNDYVESESISEDNAADIIDALELIYLDGSNDPDVQEEAAVLAGEIAINSDPEAKELLDNIVSVLTGLTGNTKAEDVLSGIFPANLSEAQFYGILDSLDTAAAAYADFAASIDSNPKDGIADEGAAAWLDNTRAGDMAMYAAVAMISSGVRAAADDLSLYNFLYNGASGIDGYDDATENPLDANSLSAILDFTGLAN